MTRNRRGFSLPELLLGFGVLMLFLGGVFGFFVKGYQAFHFLQTRQSIQGQVLRLKSVLEADFRMTHFRSIGVETASVTVAGQPQSRDNACCLILDNWQDPNNYQESSGIPKWNRYAVYQSSTTEEGTLERLVVVPEGTVPLRVRPLDQLSTISTLSGTIVGRQLLCSNLLSFSCQRDAYDQDVELSFSLKDVGGRRGLDQKATEETFQAVFRWTPNNTVPRF